MSGMTGMLSSTMEITDYVSDSIKKINKVNYTAPNRQLMTLHSNIGKYKTDVIEERIKDINLEANVIKITK